MEEIDAIDSYRAERKCRRSLRRENTTCLLPLLTFRLDAAFQWLRQTYLAVRSLPTEPLRFS